jgi:uncharacterized protein
MKYIPRQCLEGLQRQLRQFPIVCLLGPRQCGKTTFVRRELPDWTYFDLEKPSHQAQVSEDPEGVLGRFAGHLIFDEAQQVPELFPVLRNFADERRGAKGQIVLLGSASPRLIKHVSESLAGRVGFLDMTPFQEGEVHDEPALWLRGGYPDAFLARTADDRARWFEAYTRTFIERDLRLYGVDVNPTQMRRLWTMLAHAHGGIVNASELGGALGMSYHTVNRYIDILEQTFLVRRLLPYFANIGKRLVKSPKVYVRDSGLLHSFLGIATQEDLATHPKRGFSWEGFVIEQVIARFGALYPQAEFFFWRTATRQEVDLLITFGGTIIPLEAKVHTAPRRTDVPGLFACMQDLKLPKGFVVHPEGERYSIGDGVEVTTLGAFLDEASKIGRRG